MRHAFKAMIPAAPKDACLPSYHKFFLLITSGGGFLSALKQTKWQRLIEASAGFSLEGYGEFTGGMVVFYA